MNEMNVLERKVNEGSKLTWQENVIYDHLEGHFLDIGLQNVKFP